MENNDNGKRKSLKRGKVLLIFFLGLCVSLIVAGGLFFASHRICYKYNDWWIKGNSIENVKEKYYSSSILYQDQIPKPRNENAAEIYYYLFDGYLDYGMIDYEPYDLYVMEVDVDGIVIDIYYERCRLCGL